MHVSLPASGVVLEMSGILQLVATSPQPLPSSSPGVLPVCVPSCAQISPFYGHQSHWIKVHPDHLILTCSSAKTPFPNEMSCTGPESYDFNISDVGNTSQPVAGRYFISILQMRKLRHREKSNLPEASGECTGECINWGERRPRTDGTLTFKRQTMGPHFRDHSTRTRNGGLIWGETDLQACPCVNVLLTLKSD